MSAVATARVPRRLASRQLFGLCAVGVAMLLATVLALVGLTNQLFWDDEANTAIYARNLLRFHRLTAWDGRNLVGYAHGGALGEDLGQELRVPPLPAYVAAAGMVLFGPTTFGGRIMFVVSGVLSVGLLAVWLRRYLGRRFPWYLPSLILAVSPAYLLYIRNCRYYALGVMFTLLVWVFWAPGPSSGRSSRFLGSLSLRSLFDGRSLLRYLGGVVAILLLISSHYLNAASVLVTLPLFFLDRRFRRPNQYLLLGIIYLAALLYAGWIWVTVNPFAADYQATIDSALRAEPHPDLWTRYYMNFWWFLRDLGTHEFFPWCLVPVLLLPWLPARLRKLRRFARRGWILLAIVVVNSALATVLTPRDMGLGPTAEMRYVVPLIAVGAAVGGLALAILRQVGRPPAAVALVLLVATNFLYPGFMIKRFDGTRLVWPPTLYRYVAEGFNDYRTGTEALVELLERVPAGTPVRVFPGHMVYPAMFYVPKLHYCDQLSAEKRISRRLKPLPDYLFVERARPQVWLVPAPYVSQQLDELESLAALGPEREADSYRLTGALPSYWQYTSKPEIPWHAFSAPPADWQRFPSMAVLVLEGSPVEDFPALAAEAADVGALFRLGLALRDAGQIEAAMLQLEKVLQVDPDHAEAHFQLGTLLMQQAEENEEQPTLAPAIEHLKAAIRLDRNQWRAYINLGKAWSNQGRTELAREMYFAALRIKPDLPIAQYNLGFLAQREPGGQQRAIVHYKAALRADPKYAAAHANWGSILYDQGKIDEAISHFREALEILPNLILARVNLGVALDARGEKQQARAELHTALDTVPADSVMAKQIRGILKKMDSEP